MFKMWKLLKCSKTTTNSEPSVTETYELCEEVGRGTFGVVRCGIHRHTKDAIACKSIRKSRLCSKRGAELVRTEVAVLKHVAGHPNVVTLKSFHEDRNAYHIVMTLCNGGQLFDSIVSAGHFSERKAAHIFRKMVDVIRHCHELGVMHRDLKPENFLLTQDSNGQELKLTDFGLSVFFNHDVQFKEAVGSPSYMAPEVLRKNYNHQADMWSLGVILYMMLSGLPPFWGRNENAIFKMVLSGTLDFQTPPWPSLSDEAKDCVRKLCTVDPAQRWTANQILTHPWLQKEAASDVPIDSVVLQRIKQFAALNRLKKTALLVIGQSLNPDEIKGMKNLFRSIDTDNSGAITVIELCQAMKQWGHKFTSKQVEAIVQTADVDGNREIDYDEFVAATMHFSKLEREDLLQKAFAKFDKNGDGRISVDELKQVLDEFQLVDSAQELLKAADTNHDGTIDYQEFRLFICSTTSQADSSKVSLFHEPSV